MRFSKHFFSNFFLIINIYISFYFCVTRDKTSVPLLAIAIQTSLEVYYREFSYPNTDNPSIFLSPVARKKWREI